MTAPVVLITGANHGIGYHTALALLEMSFRVAVFDLSGENLTSCQASYPDRLRYYPCDVSNESAVVSAVASVIAEWQRIDILVNNACLAVFGSFEEKDLGETRREFEVNYFGYIHTIKAVLPSMKAQGGGIIHNVSSTVGITGFPGIYGYASAKGAIEALTRTCAIEFEPYGITVNLIHPTITNTRSVAPLGLPAQAMADPAKVGRGIAGKILSTKVIITADLQTSLGVFLSRHFPEAMGRLMAKLSQRARKTDTD